MLTRTTDTAAAHIWLPFRVVWCLLPIVVVWTSIQVLGLLALLVLKYKFWRCRRLQFLQVLSLLALMVQKYKFWRCRRLQFLARHSVYLLDWCKSTNSDAADASSSSPSTQFTCFTGTKVQILTLQTPPVPRQPH
jgi:hypothetical protein